MNKIIVVATRIVLLTAVCFQSFSLSANTESTLTSKSDMDFADAEVIGRINNLQSIVSVRYSKEVKARIKMYVKTYPKGTEQLLGRSAQYFPLFESKLKERKLPTELKYLALVESALRGGAKSKSGAGGLWQFMKGTGRMYGLEIDRSLDERYDVIKSTDAALTYLTDLYKRYDDWTLALAAYNCGPGNVNKAIRRGNGSRDFWKIRKYMPKETREYIPRFIAASYLMEHYKDHQLVPNLPEGHAMNTASAKVYARISFKEIAQATGLKVYEIAALNPSFLKNYIPANKSGNNLTLPEASLFDFFIYKGYSLVDITRMSRKAKPKVKLVPRKQYEQPTLLAAIPTKELPNHSTTMDVPMSVSIGSSSQRAQGKRSKFYDYHKMAKRESILDIVRKNEDLKLAEILTLNNISLSNPPLAGSFIKLRRK